MERACAQNDFNPSLVAVVQTDPTIYHHDPFKKSGKCILILLRTRNLGKIRVWALSYITKLRFWRDKSQLS